MPNPPIVIKLLAISHGVSSRPNLSWTIPQLRPSVERQRAYNPVKCAHEAGPGTDGVRPKAIG